MTRGVAGGSLPNIEKPGIAGELRGSQFVVAQFLIELPYGALLGGLCSSLKQVG
jgi:hypothetical protein